MEKKRAPELDWVNAFAACSLGIVFQKLRLQVAEDVKARNAQFQSVSIAVSVYKYQFVMTEYGERFSVTLQGVNIPPVPHRAIAFSLEDKKIAVTDVNGNRVLDATLTLNNEGECRLKVGERECEFWQVRRMALQKLFFEII